MIRVDNRSEEERQGVFFTTHSVHLPVKNILIFKVYHTVVPGSIAAGGRTRVLCFIGQLWSLSDLQSYDTQTSINYPMLGILAVCQYLSYASYHQRQRHEA